MRKKCVQTPISNKYQSVRKDLRCTNTTTGIFCPQVQDEELQSSRGKGEDRGKDQEPWIGVVPINMDDSKASTGNQESFADTMVNKVRKSTESGSGVHVVLSGMYKL